MHSLNANIYPASKGAKGEPGQGVGSPGPQGVPGIHGEKGKPGVQGEQHHQPHQKALVQILNNKMEIFFFIYFKVAWTNPKCVL